MNPAIVQVTLWNLNLELRLIGLIALLIGCAIYPPYIQSMVRGRATPPRSSWFLWLLLDAVILLSQLANRNLDAMMVAYTGGTFAVAVATLKYGKHGWTRIETACVVIVGAALAVWAVLGPSVATLCGLIGITVGLVPVLENVLHGRYDDRRAWAIAATASIVNTFDGQLLTGFWFATLQLSVLAIIVYHWGWRRTP